MRDQEGRGGVRQVERARNTLAGAHTAEARMASLQYYNQTSEMTADIKERSMKYRIIIRNGKKNEN